MRIGWRRWIPGPKHGPARSAAVYGMPSPDPGRLDELLGRCEQLRAWARSQGFDLEGVPDDLRLLDHALDEATEQARSELGGWTRIAEIGSQAGLFVGTVITATVPGTRWRLWPNGHPVVRLASGGDLDVVALGNERVSKGTPLLAAIYASAQPGPPR